MLAWRKIRLNSVRRQLKWHEKVERNINIICFAKMCVTAVCELCLQTPFWATIKAGTFSSTNVVQLEKSSGRHDFPTLLTKYRENLKDLLSLDIYFQKISVQW